MEEFDYLLELPGTPQEREWLEERLETLSVREGYVLAAESMRRPPGTAAEAINSIQNLSGCEIHLAGSYEELGRFSLDQASKLPEDVLPYVDFDHIGQQFENEHPGLFIGSCYVEYPKEPPELAYRGEGTPLPEDSDWSVKLKLASPAVPEGAWLRLPDYDGQIPEKSGEVTLVLEKLRVKSLEDCTLLEARCILPEAGDLKGQYDNVTELVRDGDNLGYILDEQGQGAPHWMEKFAAALEYEGCHTLKFVLDISQNLHCYEWVPHDNLKEFAAKNLRSYGVSEELIQSGNINLKDYAEDLLDTSGYMEASGDTGYLIRNSREFVRKYTAEDTPSWQDVLKAAPRLEQLSGEAGSEDTAATKTAIIKALAGRGADGIRQLQAAMECERCGSLEDAAGIASHLESYDFVEMAGFEESVKQELLAKGLNEEVIRSCIDFGAYAAISYGYDSVYNSFDTGLYVHKSAALSQPEQGGMTMQ